MIKDNPKYNQRFEAPAQGFAVGEKNTIYNYYYYREETKVDSGKSDKSTAAKKLPCPYRGLYHFEPKDAKLFFGREVFVTELFQATRTRRFIPVLGASGSGKSSVVLAGLVPKLQQKGNWQFTHFRPGSEPFLALAQALVPLYQPNLDMTEQMCQKRKLAKYFQDGSVLLQDVFAQIERNYPNQRVLLIADQFEELYTLCPDETIRRKFLDLLLDSFGTNTQDKNFLPTLVTTMRADFLGNALSYRPFADILRDSDIKLGAMNREELSQVITQPAATLGVTLEHGLVERILTDVEDEPGNLALLEFALTELWREGANNKLTHQSYEKIGQVKGALAKYAEEQYQQLTEAEQKQAQQIFVQLVRLGEENNDTRRRVNRNQLGEANWQLVTRRDGLADSRLVVTSLAENEERETIEVVHEALIRHWQRLRQWIDGSREQLKQQHKLEDEAKQWQDSGYKIDYLLSKKRLKEAKEFQQEQQQHHPLSQLAKKFINSSIKQQKRERIKTWGLFAIIPLIGTVVGGYFIVTEIQLNADKRLIRDCPKQENNCPGRTEALERLVEAKRNLKTYNLSDANLVGAELIGADLSYANLKGATLATAKLINANLQIAELNGAILSSADLQGANLSIANLNDAKLNGTVLVDADLSYAYLKGAILNAAELIGADLTNASLDDANLSHTNLSDTKLFGAKLFNANLFDANLFGSNLGQVNLSGANLDSANLIDSKNLTSSQIKLACNWNKAMYKGDFKEGEWAVDREANQQYIKELKQDKASDPKELVDCSKWDINSQNSQVRSYKSEVRGWY